MCHCTDQRGLVRKRVNRLHASYALRTLSENPAVAFAAEIIEAFFPSLHALYAADLWTEL